MWRKVDEPAAKAQPSAKDVVAHNDVAPSGAVARKPAPIDVTKEVELPPPTPVAMTPDGKKIIDTGSDDFYKHFIEIIPKRLWKEAAVCYEGRLGTRHRNSKMKLLFDVVVKNGVATIQNTRVGPDEEDGSVNTINDSAVESCFFQHVARYTWNANDDMPEGYAMPAEYRYEDSLVIRPERSKKYYKDNVDYVGGEAPAPLPSQLPQR
ncbi:MAG: hypothetical protein KF773_26880 [Deltaproteobacteria bacterium]|nr:hypothetical protein [Deltaproteobacteria bacterium]